MNSLHFVLLAYFNTCSNIKHELAPHIKHIFLSHCWTRLQSLFLKLFFKTSCKTLVGAKGRCSLLLVCVLLWCPGSVDTAGCKQTLQEKKKQGGKRSTGGKEVTHRLRQTTVSRRQWIRSQVWCCVYFRILTPSLARLIVHWRGAFVSHQDESWVRGTDRHLSNITFTNQSWLIKVKM